MGHGQWGHPGQGYSFCPWSVGQPVPFKAIRGGHDVDGSPIYVGRAFHNGDSIPAKVIPNKNAAYIAWGGQEIMVRNDHFVRARRTNLNQDKLVFKN